MPVSSRLTWCGRPVKLREKYPETMMKEMRHVEAVDDQIQRLGGAAAVHDRFPGVRDGHEHDGQVLGVVEEGVPLGGSRRVGHSGSISSGGGLRLWCRRGLREWGPVITVGSLEHLPHPSRAQSDS